MTTDVGVVFRFISYIRNFQVNFCMFLYKSHAAVKFNVSAIVIFLLIYINVINLDNYLCNNSSRLIIYFIEVCTEIIFYFKDSLRTFCSTSNSVFLKNKLFIIVAF